jgi:hypothetical protein
LSWVDLQTEADGTEDVDDIILGELCQAESDFSDNHAGSDEDQHPQAHSADDEEYAGDNLSDEQCDYNSDPDEVAFSSDDDDAINHNGGIDGFSLDADSLITGENAIVPPPKKTTKRVKV